MLAGHDCDDDTLHWWNKLVHVSSEEIAHTYSTNSNAHPVEMHTDCFVRLPLLANPLLETEDMDTKPRPPGPGVCPNIVLPTQQNKHYSPDQNPSPTKCDQFTKRSQTQRETHKRAGKHPVPTNTQQFSQLVLTPPTPCYSSGIVTHFTCPVCLLYFGSILDQQREHHSCQTCGFRV
jgi:hypothetical protein